MKSYSTNKGKTWFNNWKIRTNVKFFERTTKSVLIKPCKHCIEIKKETVYNFSKSHSWKQVEWICPRIVVFYLHSNNNDGICLDCVLETLDSNKSKEIKK